MVRFHIDSVTAGRGRGRSRRRVCWSLMPLPSDRMAGQCSRRCTIRTDQRRGITAVGGCAVVSSPCVAGGTIIGGIAGDAGKGAAIGLLRRGIQNSNARASGYCY